MRTIKKNTIIIIALVLAAGINLNAQQARGVRGAYGAGASYGQGAGYGQNNRNAYRNTEKPSHGYGYMYSALDLTEEQEAQLKKLWQDHYNEIQPMWENMAELKLKKRNLMNDAELDVKALNNIIDKITALQNNIEKKRVSHRKGIEKVLTDEQAAIFRTRGSNAYGRGHRKGAGFGYGEACKGARYGGRGAGNGYHDGAGRRSARGRGGRW